VVQHGGDWAGQHSGFLMVPERDFALTVLTNAETGPVLLDDLFGGDWALNRFAGVHNLPATPRSLSDRELAPYRGFYSGTQIGFAGETATVELEIVPDAGGLSVRYLGAEAIRLVFYRKDYVLTYTPDGTLTTSRFNFVRDPDGSVGWLRFGGRIYRHSDTPAQPAGALRSTAPGRLPSPLLS
jgi:hypothetical protein